MLGTFFLVGSKGHHEEHHILFGGYQERDAAHRGAASACRLATSEVPSLL